MEISFISEVGKKNVPETSSITNLEGKTGLGTAVDSAAPSTSHREIVPSGGWERAPLELSSAVQPQRPAIKGSIF